MIASFIGRLREHVVQKDRILRGNGVEFPPTHDAGDWHGLSPEEIRQRGLDLKRALYPSLPTTTKQRSEGFVRALYKKTSANRLRQVMFRDVGKELGWPEDHVRTAVDYAVESGLAEWKAMGGWIAITTAGIDLAEQTVVNDSMEEPAVDESRSMSRLGAPITFSGSVTNSIIQVAGDNARQSAIASPEAVAALKEFSTLLRPVLEGINQQTSDVVTLKAHVASLDAQLAAPSPRRSILLEIAKGILESLASEAIKHVVLAAMPSAPALLQQIVRLLLP